jgi:type III pantothenate kinase
MNLIVDIGNSYSKFYVFENDVLVDEFKFVNDEIILEKIFEKHQFIKNAIVSSVTNFEIIEKIKQKVQNVIEFNHETKIPIKNTYETPKTLGLDRIAAVVGAWHLFQNQNVMIIDAGTAVTYEFLDSENNYLGGNISPGLLTRFKSLNTFTKKLPLVSPKDEFQIIGKTTENAILAGVQQGLIFEMNSYIEHFEKSVSNLNVILTGGDCFFFDKKLKKTIFVVPNLIALGLNQILKLNV